MLSNASFPYFAIKYNGVIAKNMIKIKIIGIFVSFRKYTVKTARGNEDIKTNLS